jgi:hypothetical protein
VKSTHIIPIFFRAISFFGVAGIIFLNAETIGLVTSLATPHKKNIEVTTIKGRIKFESTNFGRSLIFFLDGILNYYRLYLEGCFVFF